MSLNLIREELDSLDNVIKNMITIRMSLIPLVAKTKIEQNLPFFQPKREKSMYDNIKKFANENGVSPELLENVYKQIIKNAIDIETAMGEGENPYNLDIKLSTDAKNKLESKFEELDEILKHRIPSIINEINSVLETQSDAENVSELYTLHYIDKILNKN